MSKKKHKQYNKNKPKKENLVYQASRALWKTENRPERKIGPITRILNFFRETHAYNKKMRGAYWLSNDKRRAAHRAIFASTCAPAYNAWNDLWDTAWNFLVRFFSDFKDLIIDIANVFITIGYYLHSFIIYISDWIADIAYWCEGRKHTILVVFATLTIGGVATVLFMSSITAYEYSYYGKKLGTAKSEKIVYDTISVIGDKLAKNAGANINIDVERDIQFTKVRGFNLKTDSPDDILNTLTYMQDLQVDAYAICVNDVDKVIVESEESARKILENIRNANAGAKEGVEYSDIHFDESVLVETRNVKLGDIWNTADAEKYLLTGSIKDITYTVAENESYTEIMDMFGVNEAQLQAANPDVDLTSLTTGQVLSLSEPDPVITVISTETATYYEDIQYTNQYIDNGAIYAGEEEIRTPGILGKNEIVATISRVNGKEISKEIISTTKLSDPVAAVVYRGTKPIPEKIGTGTFILPIRTYYVSSRVGPRWGRIHKGIDLAAATGTKIYASDGGVVTFSGWQNGLGYVIYIDHGGLLETVYGHCSKLLVSEGDKVYQGQNIALVGSTGNSTGPHLHFEIHYNGEYQNPENYLDF